jgi:hypothetical protein
MTPMVSLFGQGFDSPRLHNNCQNANPSRQYGSGHAH